MPEQAERETVDILPFSIEIDHPRNSDVLLQAIPGQRLRSAIDGSKPVIDRKTGDARIPRDQANFISGFPRSPGQQLHLNPQTCEIEIIDPLYTDDVLCERIRKFLEQNTQMNVGSRLRGVPPIKQTLDVHRFKTLCFEVECLVRAGEAKRRSGMIPSIADIAELPGEELLNPGSRVQNTQPMYKKDWDAWVDRLTRSGG